MTNQEIIDGVIAAFQSNPQLLTEAVEKAQLPPGFFGPNVYIGMRYVPIFDGEWDASKSYEPLTVVTYQGNSYTSRTFVAAGILVSNSEYWAATGNYNAQVELYRQEVVRIAEELKEKPDYNPTPNAQYDYYVSTTGNDNGTGSQTEPFATIQHAIDTISNLVAQPGNYTIHVASGVYNEALLIKGITPKTGAVLIDCDNATLDGGGLLYRGIQMHECHNVSFRNLTVQNYTNSCVFIRESVIITFYSCHIIGTPNTFGYHVIDHSTYFLNGGTVSNCKHGISEYFHVLRSVASIDDEGPLTISNCSVGLFTKELCTGHFNDATITGCNFAFYATRGSTANLARTKFRSCTYGALLTNGSEAWLGSTILSQVVHPWIADYSSAAVLNEDMEIKAKNITYTRGHRVVAMAANDTPVTPNGTLIDNLATWGVGSFQTEGLSFTVKVVIHVSEPPSTEYKVSLKIGGFDTADITIPANNSSAELEWTVFKQSSGSTLFNKLLTDTGHFTTLHGHRAWNNFNNAKLSLLTTLTSPVVIQYVEVTTTDTPTTMISSDLAWPPVIPN